MWKLVFLPLSHHALFMWSDLTYMSQADCDDRSSCGAAHRRPDFLVLELGLLPLLSMLPLGLSLPCGNELKWVFNHTVLPHFEAKPLCAQSGLLSSQGILLNSWNPKVPFVIPLPLRLCQLSHWGAAESHRLTKSLVSALIGTACLADLSLVLLEQNQ